MYRCVHLCIDVSMDPCIYVCNHILEVGGVVQALVLPPNREIDFDCACVCVACVRASERSCERETILQWLGLGARICGSSVRPSVVRAAMLKKKLRAVRHLTDDSCSFGGGECFAVVVSSSRWCFVRVSWVPCWIVVLDHQRQPSRCLFFVRVLRVFRGCLVNLLDK